jgi:hypothetical protein
MPKESSTIFDARIDASRSDRVKAFVERMYEILRGIEAGQIDLKAVAVECEQRGFKKREIAAMRKIAKLSLDDKISQARDSLDALRRISSEAGVDLFDPAADGR